MPDGALCDRPEELPCVPEPSPPNPHSAACASWQLAAPSPSRRVLLVAVAANAQDETTDLSTSSTDLGTFLVDGAGSTLYYFEPDPPGASVCAGDCLAAWPAVTVDGANPLQGDETVTGTLGVIAREDGEQQATYRGRPLYYFSGDEAAGDTNGQGISDVWWVAAEDGSLTNAEPVTDAALTLEAASSDLGTFITGADGRTAYFFQRR